MNYYECPECHLKHPWKPGSKPCPNRLRGYESLTSLRQMKGSEKLGKEPAKSAGASISKSTSTEVAATPSDAPTVERIGRGNFDRRAYQRDLMRKRRAAERERKAMEGK